MKKIISVLLACLTALSFSITAFAAEKELDFDPSWVVSASSDLGTTIEKAFDGDVNTYWHTKYTGADGVVTSHDECPHTITVNFGKKIKVSGWEYTPRIDNGTGTVLSHNIYASEDGKSFKLIYSSVFGYDAGNVERLPKKESWGDVTMRAIKIEVVSSLGGYGTAAEIKFYTGGSGTTVKDGSAYSEAQSGKTDSGAATDASGRHASDGTPLLSKAGWQAEVNSGANSVSKIFDGSVDTYWHSSYQAVGSEIVSHDNPPYHLIVTLPEAVLASGIMLTPRTDNSAGRIMGADIYISDTDDGEWYLLREKAEFAPNDNPRDITFTANLKIKRVWVEVTSGMAGYGTLAEFDLMAAKDGYETVAYADYAKHEEENMLYEIDRINATAEYYGDNWGTNTPTNVLDGANATFWQTDEIMVSEWPVILTVDLKDKYTLQEIRYTPRQSDDCHGAWLDVSVSGSSDGEEWVVLNDGVTMDKDLITKSIKLENGKNIRYIEFQINKANASRVSCAELTFWQSKTDMQNSSRSAKYIMQIGSKTIKSIQGDEESVKELDVAPYIINGSTMIPLRGLLEEMGAEITWDGATETITVDNGQNIITLQIWNYLVYVQGTRYGDLRYTLLNPPIINESRTFIPIRFISEQLGYNVSWDGETQTITIER